MACGGETLAFISSRRRSVEPARVSAQKSLRPWAHRRWMFCLAISLWQAASAPAAESAGIVGKSGWLFVRHEQVLEVLDKDAQKALALVAKFDRMLALGGTALLVVVVPSKMETYVEHLPDGWQLTPYMTGFNGMLQAAFQRSGVQYVDLKKPLREAALQDTSATVFYRLDTHWTPTGAAVAARAIQAGISASPQLKKVVDALPAEPFKLTWAAKPQRQSTYRDILRFLPEGAAAYDLEQVLRFKVSKEGDSRMSLLSGQQARPGIGLVGSSFSGNWTGFADALRYSLQRDVFNFSVDADAGQWAVMRAYLRDDVFQDGRPKLVIWEMPERAAGWRPSYPHRLERYRIDDNEWLLQVAALVQPNCQPAGILAKPANGFDGIGNGMAKNARETDFVEIHFDARVDASVFLSASLTTDGSRHVRIETFDGNVPLRKFDIEVAGDDQPHLLKTPLVPDGKAVNRIRIFPGKTNAFALSDIKVCRYAEDWLK